jgi:hypothetical protein
MSIRSLRKLFAGTALAFAAVTTMAAVPAAAASTPAPAAWTATHPAATAGQGTSASGRLQADVTCPNPKNRFTIYATTCKGVSAYTACKSYDQGSMPFIPRYASNGCSVRVWLYRGAHRTGKSPLCISPRTADSYLHTNYVWYWISANKAKC